MRRLGLTLPRATRHLARRVDFAGAWEAACLINQDGVRGAGTKERWGSGHAGCDQCQVIDSLLPIQKGKRSRIDGRYGEMQPRDVPVPRPQSRWAGKGLGVLTESCQSKKAHTHLTIIKLH